MLSDTLATFARVCIAICLMIPAARSSATYPASQSARFKISISIDRRSLTTDFYRSTGRFYVDTKIRNISSMDQTITVWTNFGWSWVSDQPDISPGIEALKNYPRLVTLKPRQEYQSRIEMISARHSRKPITFRLGLVPDALKPVSANRQDYKDVTWSNPVVFP